MISFALTASNMLVDVCLADHWYHHQSCPSPTDYQQHHQHQKLATWFVLAWLTQNLH